MAAPIVPSPIQPMRTAPIVGSGAMRGDERLPGRLFGLLLGFIAVVALQVAAFDESWPAALLFGLLLTAAAAVFLFLRDRR